MPKYLLSYHGGDMPESEWESTGQAWGRWMDGLGAAMIDRGGPLEPGHTILSGGTVVTNGGANPVTGYSVIEAENLDAAMAMAMGCPQIGPPHDNGSIEVSEMIAM